MRVVRRCGVAALSRVHGPGWGHHGAVVRTVRTPVGGAGAVVRRLPAELDLGRPGAVPVRRATGPGGPGHEVLRMARGGPPPGRWYGRRGGRPPPRRGGDVGPALATAPGPTRLRPGRGAGPGGGRASPPPGSPAPGPGPRHPGPGSDDRSTAPAGARGCVRGTRGVRWTGPADRRRPHHRRYSLGVRPSPSPGRGPTGHGSDGGPIPRWARPGPLPGDWLPGDRASTIDSGSSLGLWLPGGCSPGSRRQPQAKRPT
jgi:hypothetical protein